MFLRRIQLSGSLVSGPPPASNLAIATKFNDKFHHLFISLFFIFIIFIFIFIKESLPICLSHLSVTPIILAYNCRHNRRHKLIICEHQVYHLKFTRCSVCALQQVEEEDAKQHSIETTTASITQLVVQLTCIQEVVGSNPAVKQIFFL